MLLGDVCRYLAAALLLAFGAGNLIGLARIAETPALKHARLLAGIGGLLTGAALLYLGAGRERICLAAGAIGICCGAAWIVLVFRQSLHNTTM